MTNIVVAFSRQGDAKNIKNILMRNGFQVVAVCTSGSQVLSSLEDLSSGIVVSGYRFEDMMYQEIREYMPKGFDMLLVALPSRFEGEMPRDVVCLSMPLKVHDLVGTLEMMCRSQVKRKRRMGEHPAGRNERELQIIARAKEILMERNNMSEREAHRYIQKCSMDSGTNMVETAWMIISLSGG
ncbi:MAG: ANTAR domain-containing protein [Hungatella sp.]|nr:ANTAR domain-containing protein [Hungatella sp.]